jgi:hypothetical protein
VDHDGGGTSGELHRRPWEAFAPLAALPAVALWIVGMLVMLLLPGDPGPAPAPDEIATHFTDNHVTILFGGFLFGLGALAFLVFVVAVHRGVETRAPGTPLPTFVLAAGIVTTVFLLWFPGPNVAAAVRAGDQERPISPEVAETLWNLGNGVLPLIGLPAALLLAATAVAALATGLLPRWLAWTSVLLALVLVIPHVGWAVLLLVFPVWVVLVGVLLYRRPVTGAGA